MPFLPLSLHPAITSLKCVHCSPSTRLSPRPKTPLPGSISCPVFLPPALSPEDFLLKYYNLFITPGEPIMYGSHHTLLTVCQRLPTALKINSRLRKTSGPRTCSHRPASPRPPTAPQGPTLQQQGTSFWNTPCALSPRYGVKCQSHLARVCLLLPNNHREF